METNFPFDGPADAWFWCVRTVEARLEGARMEAGLATRPRDCEAADILAVVLRARRAGRLDARDLVVLAHYGKAGYPPDPRRPDERAACPVWRDALATLLPALVAKGLIAPEVPGRRTPPPASRSAAPEAAR